jgi:signal transduction histidine kinase
MISIPEQLIILIAYLVFIIAELLLLGFAILRRRNYRTGTLWLAATIVPIIAATALQLLPADWVLQGRFTRDYLIWLALIAVAVIYGGMVIHDISRDEMLPRMRRVWLALAVLWASTFIVTGIAFEPLFTGWANWQTNLPLMPALIGAVGGAVYGLFLLGLSFYCFYIAPMPEVANRAAFWIVTTGLFLASIALIASGSTLLMVTGTVLLYTGLVVATYGMRYYRLVDIRETIVALARTASVIAISWAFIFVVIYFLNRSNLRFSLPEGNTGILIVAGMAILVAISLVPARQIIEFFFRQMMIRTRPNLAAATASYSQRVARASTLEEVVNATTETLNRVMGVRRSALILINNTVRVPDAVELIVLEMGATLNNPTLTGYLHKKSPVYQVLAIGKVPLGQYDIDYGPSFQTVAPQEKQFFRDMRMSAFVPILADNRLVGLLASGPKLNDTPYHREDVELLSVIGQQVGTALRSARLIDDLQHLNDSMRMLNKRLETAKIELEKLDSVKTDFITIASHELRTPLAQIRGYTDIIDSLNEQGNLKPGQATGLVQNLRKSTERMEELISAMLDVSQIDVNSMDLRFVRTSPETIVKMALEPLRDPAQERNIQFVRTPSSDLPTIEADLQRMVQALRNIILNAIKFTPDGGSIEIGVSYEPAKADTELAHVLFKIKDTGVGISTKDIQYIFNKFYRGFDTQLHSTGIYKFMGAGPGLGLTIAKGIIEGHGGEIWVESPGHSMTEFPGSSFYVRLPLQPPAGTRRVLPFEEDVNKTQGIPDLSHM